MENYIAILRGINVSGQKMIKMAELKTQMETLGFTDVSTYIQSGNILFRHRATPAAKLAGQIADKIRDFTGFEVPVIVKTAGDLERVLANNPFLNRDHRETERLYVTFLDREPGEDALRKLETYDYSPEAYIVSGDVIYFYSPHGYGNAKMNNNFFESRLKVTATTRNWKTVGKLYELATK